VGGRRRILLAYLICAKEVGRKEISRRIGGRPTDYLPGALGDWLFERRPYFILDALAPARFRYRPGAPSLSLVPLASFFLSFSLVADAVFEFPDAQRRQE